MSWRSKSYEELPALAVRGPELRKSLRTVTVAWMYGVVWLACVSGAQMQIFPRMLGFNDFDFGLMNAIPFAATFSQLFAAVVIERTGLRKYQFMDCAAAHRILWLAIAAIPLIFPVPSVWAVAAMLIVLGISWFMESLARPAWLTWMGDLIPRRIRGRYFANRDRLTQAIMIAVVIGIGILLDAVTIPGAPKEDPHVQRALLATLCILFGVATVFGTIDILLFRRIREVVPRHAQRRPPLPESWLGIFHHLLVEPLQDRVFRHYVGFSATVTFSVTLTTSYFWLNVKENLLFSNLASNCLFLVFGPLAAIAVARGWGRLIDRWGRRPALIIGTIGTALCIVPWLFITRYQTAPKWFVDALNHLCALAGAAFGQAHWRPIADSASVMAYLLASAACILGGAAWSGVNLAGTAVTLGFADGQGRSKFVAAASVMISLGGVLGGVAGGIITQSMHGLQHHPIGPFLWNNWHLTFLLAIFIRLASLLWLVKMPDAGAAPVPDMIRHMMANGYNNVSTRLFYPLRAFGWGRDNDKEDKSWPKNAK